MTAAHLFRRPLASLSLSLWLMACSAPETAPGQTESAEATAETVQTERATSAARLTLAAPSSLKEVANDLAEQYTKQHPEVAVQVTTGASGTLLQQLRQGAPIDVLLSADTKTMTQAQEADLLAGSPQTLAYNSLVLIAPAAATAPGGDDLPAALEWLAKQPRVAVGQPDSVPAGRYAQASLTDLGVWPSLQERLVYGQNVRQVLDWVARGEAGAGMVYATDAAVMADDVQTVVTLPLQTPVEYQAAVTGRAPAAAEPLLEFLNGPQAQATLEAAGFLTERPE
ncbi:molybdate ABC transporter substrate-binding protein [Deinococcus radiophilus]|nr:molybdate ABC transporter substrate-binding protein [Deinococcus radiophilus]UFA51635.1 molybdate ABC transporter substrate-binding protein [Deinococcus radiophilus]